MLQKIKSSLICTAVILLSTQVWASPNAVQQYNIAQVEPKKLAPGETLNLFNPAPWVIAGKCKISTEDQGCHPIYAQHVNNTPSCTVNGLTLKDSDSLTLIVCHDDSLDISAESAARVLLTNQSTSSFIEISCSRK